MPLALLINKFTLVARPNGWMLIWDAAILADQRPLVFGDQEEMGFGARMATPFTEKNGGVLRSSTGKRDWPAQHGGNPPRGAITPALVPNPAASC